MTWNSEQVRELHMDCFKTENYVICRNIYVKKYEQRICASLQPANCKPRFPPLVEVNWRDSAAEKIGGTGENGRVLRNIDPDAMSGSREIKREFQCSVLSFHLVFIHLFWLTPGSVFDQSLGRIHPWVGSTPGSDLPLGLLWSTPGSSPLLGLTHSRFD